jgi:hypothetical protein
MRIFKALNHDFRKRLLEKIAERQITYTELLNWSGVESGYLAYHLRAMGPLLEKGDSGYNLTPLGVEGLAMLRGQVEAPRPFLTRTRIIVILLVLTLLTSGVYLAYSLTSAKQSAQVTHEQRVATLRAHANESLALIIGAFDYVYLPRSVWADIVVHSALLRQDIEALQTEDPNAVSTPLVQSIDHFLGEAQKVLSASDSEYIELSWENRQLLRDLHYGVFTLCQGLESGL